MGDRENVIESLNKALTRVEYGDMDNVTLSEVEDAIESAITLLREQEPVRPIKKLGIVEAFKCGACKWVLGWTTEFPLYCPRCGRKVDWNV